MTIGALGCTPPMATPSCPMKRALQIAVLLLPACASSTPTVRGRARVVTWDDVKVVAFCDSPQRYQLGVFTSNAAGTGARDVEQQIAEGAGPVLVELTAFPASLPSSWKAAPGVDGVLSVGFIGLASGRCPGSP